MASDRERNVARMEHLKSRLQVLMGRFDVLVGLAKQVDAIQGGPFASIQTDPTNAVSKAQEALDASLEDLEAGLF